MRGGCLMDVVRIREVPTHALRADKGQGLEVLVFKTPNPNR